MCVCVVYKFVCFPIKVTLSPSCCGCHFSASTISRKFAFFSQFLHLHLINKELIDVHIYIGTGACKNLCFHWIWGAAQLFVICYSFFSSVTTELSSCGVCWQKSVFMCSQIYRCLKTWSKIFFYMLIHVCVCVWTWKPYFLPGVSDYCGRKVWRQHRMCTWLYRVQDVVWWLYFFSKLVTKEPLHFVYVGAGNMGKLLY